MIKKKKPLKDVKIKAITVHPVSTINRRISRKMELFKKQIENFTIAEINHLSKDELQTIRAIKIMIDDMSTKRYIASKPTHITVKPNHSKAVISVRNALGL